MSGDLGPDALLDAPVPGGELRGGIWHPEATGGDVLALHGITANLHSFALIAGELPDVRVAAPDQRGRGRSRDLPPPWGLDDLADDAARFADAVGMERPVVLGHSMGAFVATRLAQRHPDRVAALVLVDGALPLAPPPPRPDGTMPTAEDLLGPALARLSMEFPSAEAYLDFFRAHPALGPYWNDAVEAYVRADLYGEEPSLRPAARLEAVRDAMLELPDVGAHTRALDAIAVPATFMRAPRDLLDGPDGMYPKAHAEQWLDRTPSIGTRIEVEDANHYGIAMTPAGARAVANAVRAHLPGL